MDLFFGDEVEWEIGNGLTCRGIVREFPNYDKGTTKVLMLELNCKQQYKKIEVKTNLLKKILQFQK